MRLPSLDQHALLVMWVQLVVVVAVARLLGAAMRRIGQPPVVGELLAGVVLGPSVLARAWPAAGHLLVPTRATLAAPLNAIGWVGVAFLLVLTGFDTDLKLIRRLGRPAAAVSVAGLAIPFAAGIGVGLLMPGYFRGGHGTAVAFVLFIAISLSISSMPVIVRVLEELGFMRRNFGQLTMAVAIVNDLVGWLALGVIATLGRTSQLSLLGVAAPIGAVAVILVLSFTVGQRIVDAALRRVRQKEQDRYGSLAVTLLVTLVLAAATQAARSDAVLGAYVAGILVGRSKFFQRRTREQLEAVTTSVLAPVFFATAGLRLDLARLANGQVALWTALVILAAIVAKVTGVLVGSRIGRLDRRDGRALAIALNARGAVEVVIATVGLTIGVLSDSAYTVILVMAVVTSVMAPPFLRLAARNWRGGSEEVERLEREEALERNLLIRPGRLMIPSRGGVGSLAAARILHAAWPPEAPVSVLSVEGGAGVELGPILAVLDGREVDVRKLEEGDLSRAILAEAKLGYSVVGLGMRDEPGPHGTLVSPVVDGVLAECDVPMVIVRQARQPARRPAGTLRILVPIAGSPPSRTAQELAYSLARATEAEVALAHVITRPELATEATSTPAGGEAQLAVATAAAGVVGQAVDHALEHDVSVQPRVRSGPSAAAELLREAREQGAHLIVLGTTVRRLEGRPFLGHTVEHVLDEAEAEVVVVATPDTLVAGGVSSREA